MHKFYPENLDMKLFIIYAIFCFCLIFFCGCSQITTKKNNIQSYTVETKKAEQDNTNTQHFNKEGVSHLTFKGIEIDGSLRNFTSQMQQAGFKCLSIIDGSAVFSGDFAGYKDCEIRVSVFNNKDNVNVVKVIFPSLNSWNELENDYHELKQMLIKKYGNPSESSENFKEHVISDDKIKLMQLKMGNCYYNSEFVSDLGSITLSIEYENPNCFLSLTYRDKLNTDMANAQALDDL